MSIYKRLMSFLSWSVAVAALFFASPLRAQDGEGGTTSPGSSATRKTSGGAAFLRLGAGAKAQGMGRARTAHAGGDFSAAFWNPAGLGEVKRPGAVISGRFLQDSAFDTQFFTGIAASPIAQQGAAAIGVLYYGVGDIEAFDARANYQGTFRNSEMALAGTYGISQGPISIGAGIRYHLQEFSGEGLTNELSGAATRNSGLGFDLGLLYRINRRFTVGMVLRDGTDIGEEDYMPTGFTLGVGYLHTLRRDTWIRGAVDLEQIKDRPIRVHLGTEYSRKMQDLKFAVRLGLSDIYLEDRAPAQARGEIPTGNNKFTVGFGLGKDWYGIDVAYIGDGLDDTVLLSLTLSR
jgi:hypothetical protein